MTLIDDCLFEALLELFDRLMALVNNRHLLLGRLGNLCDGLRHILCHLSRLICIRRQLLGRACHIRRRRLDLTDHLLHALDHRVELMGDMGELIVTVEHNLRAQIARCNMTCALKNRIHGVLNAAQEQDEGNHRQNNNDNERNQCRRLNPRENIFTVRHLRTCETHAVRLVLLEEIGHTLIDVGLIIECERNCSLMIARVHQICSTLAHIGIFLALLLEFVDACKLL